MTLFVPPVALEPLLRQIDALAQERGLDAMAVGGTVRDALIGRAIRDVDIAVDRDALSFARTLADALSGHFVELDGEQAIARVVLDHEAVDYVDVAQLQGSLEDDLRRRDFTVDALAAPLAGGPVVDATGGLDDLPARLVRMTSPAAFDADPLRLLRGARIASELQFELEAETERAIRERASEVLKSAAERRRDELARIFALDDAYGALLLLDRVGLLDAILPEVTFARGVTQPGGFHAYDVFEHNLRAVEALDAMLRTVREGSAPAGVIGAEIPRTFGWCIDHLRAYFGEELSEGRTRASLTKLAGLLHDVAKPQTRVLDEAGAHFYGHAEQGAAIAARVLRRLRYSGSDVAFVSRLIEEHLRPVQLAQVGEAPTRRALYRFYRDLGHAVPALLFLSLADAAASRGPHLTPEGWRQHVGYMNSLLVRSFEDDGIVNPPRLLTGHDIMFELGLPEGPRIGELLEAVREAQATGEVHDRQEALAFVRAYRGE
ncbi:MAG TPA: HD domain-containing protein [Dehalococcoidia bacterium]